MAISKFSKIKKYRCQAGIVFLILVLGSIYFNFKLSEGREPVTKIVYKISETIENGNTILQVSSPDTSLWQNEFFKNIFGSFLGGLFGFIFAYILWSMSSKKEKEKINEEEEKVLRNVLRLINAEIKNNLYTLNNCFSTEQKLSESNNVVHKYVINSLAIHCYENLFKELSTLPTIMLEDILVYYDTIETCKQTMEIGSYQEIYKNENAESLKTLQDLMISIYNTILIMSKKHKEFSDLENLVPEYIKEKFKIKKTII